MSGYVRPVIVRGDARALPIADATADLVVTSPPYYRMRSYQDHGRHYTTQIGAEATPARYLDALIACTREMVRILKPIGSIFVNLGDIYQSTSPRRQQTSAVGGESTRTGRVGQVRRKSLVGLPWRYALACIDDLGLILRAEIIWDKPNAMPESVTDRVRRSHEHWFHFVTQPDYYSAVDRIRRPHRHTSRGRNPYGARGAHYKLGTDGLTTNGLGAHRTGRDGHLGFHPRGALPGSVWAIPTQPLSVPAGIGVTHYAAFPTAWPHHLILGWSPQQVCTACGQGRRPVPVERGLDLSRPQARRAAELAEHAGLSTEHLAALRAAGVSDTARVRATQTGAGRNTDRVRQLAAQARDVLGGYAREFVAKRPVAYREACHCPDTTAVSTPGVVVDPFGGTGTTALAAAALGRTAISVDASHDYGRLATWRTCDNQSHTPAAPDATTETGLTSACGQGGPTDPAGDSR